MDWFEEEDFSSRKEKLKLLPFLLCKDTLALLFNMDLNYLFKSADISHTVKSLFNGYSLEWRAFEKLRAFKLGLQRIHIVRPFPVDVSK